MFWSKYISPGTVLARIHCFVLQLSLSFIMAANTTTEPAHLSSSSDRIEEKPQLAHTATNISMSPELFEKLYLSPKVPHKSDNVGKYANATPLGFLGYVIRLRCDCTVLICASFVIATFTFSMVLMGWGGANGLPAVA
jgi:hypothetical protein